MFISRSGEKAISAPEEMIRIPDGVNGIIDSYLVELFVYEGPNFDEHKKVGQEFFSENPTDNQLIWALSKNNAQCCTVKKFREFNYNF